MKQNVGRTDRIARIAAAVALSILTYAGIIPENLAVVVYVIAGIIALTGIVRFCPLYKPFGISTCREKAPF
ncbi:YgaP family membrane protein [Aquirufa sp. Wall-65K1]